ncbi:MAG: hypothetical protein J0L92_08700 [Deltaproteobacteria bacterium]|nr:hypothetical protein [Deltaproteobacteria bacterium]
MTNKRYFGPDPDTSRLRATVALLGREIDRLAPAAATPSIVQEAFRLLVVQLALGPEPVGRACAHCKTLGTGESTLCGNCWAPFSPEAAVMSLA